MANVIFKGFKLVTSGYTDWSNDIVYFVRTNDDKNDGYIRFNGKLYGTAKDVEAELKGIIGTLPSEYATVVAYIAAAEQAAKDYADAQVINEKSGHTITLNGADIKLDGYAKAETASAIETTDTVNVALGKLEKGLEDAVAGGLQAVLSGNGISVSEISENKQTVSVKLDENTESFLTVGEDGLKLSGVTNAIDVAKEDAKGYASGYTDDKIAELDANISGESNNVKVAVAEADGKITEVVVEAPDFANLYDEKGAAASALTAATAYADEKLSGLDAEVSGESNDVKVTVKEADGKLTEVSVEAPDFANTYDAKGAAASAKTEVIGTASESANTLGKLETAILDNEEVTASALTALNTALSAETTARTAADEALDARIDALEAISGSSHTHENMSVLDGITAEKVAAWEGASAYTDNAIAALDSEVSGESNDVKVTVKEVNGKLTEVAVEAPDFANTYDAKGAADSALTAATAYTDNKIAELDAVVTGETSGVTVTVTEENGKLTAATAEVHVSASDNNALKMNSDGLFAAIYYEDLDS